MSSRDGSIQCLFFFFNDTATTEIYTLSLHDALPICATTARRSAPRTRSRSTTRSCAARSCPGSPASSPTTSGRGGRSEEHTSELQSRQYLVCRLLLEKKKKKSTQCLHSICRSTAVST